MNRPLFVVASVGVLMILALMANVTYIQGFQAQSLRTDPLNTRNLFDQFKYERGPILAGGKEIAYSRKTDDKRLRYQRVYRDGPMYAPVTGYTSIYSSTGLENAESSLLNGTDQRLALTGFLDKVLGKQPRGASVQTTVEPDVQAAAYQGLREHSGSVGRGAAVALDPRSGAILGMATLPSYDPNDVATHNFNRASKVLTALTKDKQQPLLNRTIAETYPPGSTFKTVDSAAALQSGQYTPQSDLHAPDRLPLPGTQVSIGNAGGESCGGTATLAFSYEMSCNTSFAWLALQLGASPLREQAGAFGFGQRFQVPMTSAASVYPDKVNDAQLALSGIGQGDVRATPLQMAMVAAGVANGGVVMKPYLVDKVRASGDNVVQEAHPSSLGRAVSSANADRIRDMMLRVVYGARGTARSIPQIPGVKIAGKTGTAEWREGASPHAWFIGFAPASAPKVAVAVIVEAGGSAGSEAFGSTVAAPIASAMMRAALDH